MAFLVPAFLAALAALVIPLLVHLRHRQRKEALRFPSLMFLRRIPFREVRRQQIQHWPLYLLRSLAVLVLALAFARPFLPEAGSTPAVASPRGRELVVLLDGSASMGFSGRWDRALDAVRSEIRGLGAGDRMTLVRFDTEAPISVGPTDDRALLEAALGAGGPGSQGTRFGPALRTAREVLLASDRPLREVVLVSDFQRSGWTGEVIEPLPEGTAFRPIDLGAVAGNVAVSGVDLALPTGGAGGGAIGVQLIASGLGVPRQGEVTLELDGRPAGSRAITLAPDGPVTIRFEGISGGEASRRGSALIRGADSLAADDRFWFVAAPPRPVRVILVNAGGAGSGSFLRQALEISRDPEVRVTVRSGVGSGDLADADVVILDDVPWPGGAPGRQLAGFISDGGGLIHVLGPRSESAWPEELIRARQGRVIDRSASGGGTLGILRRDHPVFEPFRQVRSGDFGAVRLFRYRQVTANAAAADSLEVLARFDDGAPALLEAAAGRGRVLIWTSALDNAWSDLPIQPVFLPLVHQLTLYAARHVTRPAARLVGDVARIDPETLGDSEGVVIVSPSGDRERRVPGPDGVAFELREAGYWEVREAGVGGRVLASVAANIGPEESNLARMEPADLALAAGAPDSTGTAVAAGDREVRSAVEREQDQNLWWFALVLLAAVLLMESVLANRRRGAVRSTGAAAHGGAA